MLNEPYATSGVESLAPTGLALDAIDLAKSFDLTHGLVSLTLATGVRHGQPHDAQILVSIRNDVLGLHGVEGAFESTGCICSHVEDGSTVSGVILPTPRDNSTLREVVERVTEVLLAAM